MVPGDLVRPIAMVYFYSTLRRVNKQIPDGEIECGTLGVVLSRPDGTWVKWFVGGRVGWSNWSFMEVVTDDPTNSDDAIDKLTANSS